MGRRTRAKRSRTWSDVAGGRCACTWAARKGRTPLDDDHVEGAKQLPSHTGTWLMALVDYVLLAGLPLDQAELEPMVRPAPPPDGRKDDLCTAYAPCRRPADLRRAALTLCLAVVAAGPSSARPFWTDTRFTMCPIRRCRLRRPCLSSPRASCFAYVARCAPLCSLAAR